MLNKKLLQTFSVIATVSCMGIGQNDSRAEKCDTCLSTYYTCKTNCSDPYDAPTKEAEACRNGCATAYASCMPGCTVTNPLSNSQAYPDWHF